MPNLYTPELISELKKLAQGLPRAEGVKAVRKRLKLSERAGRDAYSNYVEGHAIGQQPSLTKSTSDKTLTTEYKTHSVHEIGDVVKLCKVDENVWRVKSFAVSQNRSGAFVWRTSFERDKNALSKEMLDQVAKTLAEVKPDWSKVKKVGGGDKGLYLLGLPDLHIGKLSDDEVWGSYDSKQAKDLGRRAVESLMARIDPKKIDRILFPVGNDLIHVDKPEGVTSNDTRQDCDTRSHKMFTTAVSLISEVVQELAKTFKVDVVMVRGNHDSETIFHLGEVFKAYFREHQNVTVDNAPTQRKYYRYHKNLFLFTHGDNEKHSDLPLIMAQERKAEWGETKHRFVMLGHYHHERVVDQKGVRIHILPSLSGVDAWHASKGYVGSNRAALGMLFDAEQGLTAQYYFYAEV